MTSSTHLQPLVPYGAHRGGLLRFDAAGQAIFEVDGAMVVDARGRISHVGTYAAVQARLESDGLTGANTPSWHQHGSAIMAPGFIDTHVHYPQVDVIGSPADGLLPWLEHYTFPAEQRFADSAHATNVANFFLDELQRNGVTTALAFATSHPASVDALFQAAKARGMRLITGKVLQDRNSPDGLRDDTEQSLMDTEVLIQRWHGVDRLGYAITPRFAPTSTQAQLQGAGDLAAKYADLWVQTHAAENLDEVAWVKQLFPQDRSYLSVYERFGLLRPRSVYAHCIWLDAADRALMAQTGAVVAVCPTSNLFLGSGFFDFVASNQDGVCHALASDVGGGTSFSPFKTMQAAYFVGREGLSKAGLSLSPSQLWRMHTQDGAAALGLNGVVGNLQVGCEADFVVLNPYDAEANPLLTRRALQANSLDELLFAMIMLGDDRLVQQTHIACVRK